MNPKIKAALIKAGEYIGLFAAFGVFGSLWINTEVERRMNELATDPATAPVVVTLQADMQNVKAGQTRIETTMNARFDASDRKLDMFSQKFLEYLERQAN